MFVLVEPRIDVGAGHDRGNLVRQAIFKEFDEVHDVMVHVCPPGSSHNREHNHATGHEHERKH